MDVRFQNNSLSVSYQNKNFQLHPIWLRERLPGEEFFDVDTHQRLYEPSSIDLDLQISSAALSDHLLNIEFNDGVKGSVRSRYGQKTARSYSTAETPSNRLLRSVRRTYSMRMAELMNSTTDRMTKVLSQRHLHLARSMAETMPLLGWSETTRFSPMTSRCHLTLIWLAT